MVADKELDIRGDRSNIAFVEQLLDVSTIETSLRNKFRAVVSRKS